MVAYVSFAYSGNKKTAQRDRISFTILLNAVAEAIP
jgi:hypothetical protein